MIPRCPKRDYPQHLIVGIEGQRGVQKLAREEATLLCELERTLASRVGRSCLYLRADSLLVKISLKLSAELAGRTLEDCGLVEGKEVGRGRAGLGEDVERVGQAVCQSVQHIIIMISPLNITLTLTHYTPKGWF